MKVVLFVMVSLVSLASFAQAHKSVAVCTVTYSNYHVEREQTYKLENGDEADIGYSTRLKANTLFGGEICTVTSVSETCAAMGTEMTVYPGTQSAAKEPGEKLLVSCSLK